MGLPDKPPTPERQLLKLIEEPQARGSIQAAAVKHQGLSLFSFGAWSGRLSFFKRGFNSSLKDIKQRRLDTRAINGILGFLVLVLFLYFIISSSISLMNLKNSAISRFKVQESGKASLDSQEVSSLKRTSAYYLDKISGRDIFKMGLKKAPVSNEPVKVVNQEVVNAAQNFKLVGISWSNDPDAMIEDTAAKKTFFVKIGQMVGEFKVQAISRDKVILNYGQEEIELK